MTAEFSGGFHTRRLLKYAVPSIVMMVFTSIYSVVDGFFVSNFAGKTPFAAVNLIMPYLMILGCVGFMFGTGGSALIAKTLGQGDRKKANEIFSFVVVACFITGVILAILGIIALPTVAKALKAEGRLYDDALLYARIILAALPFYVLQYEFQCLFACAGKPKLGLYVTVSAGVANMVLDALFCAVFPWGIAGAAAATAVSQFIGGVVPIIYFARKNTSILHLCRFRFDGKVLLKTCTNGSSELMSNISASIVSMLYNLQLMKYLGENGIAAYGVLMYVSMIFQAVFIGYAVGTAPVVAYKFGEDDRDELHCLLRRSIRVVAVFAIAMFAVGELLASPLAKIFVSYDKELMELTVHAFRIFSFSFLFSGFAIYGSSFFTALNDGLTSALISFLRTLVFQIAAVLLFPLILDVEGIWLSIVAAEVMAVICTVLFLTGKRKKYGY